MEKNCDSIGFKTLLSSKSVCNVYELFQNKQNKAITSFYRFQVENIFKEQSTSETWFSNIQWNVDSFCLEDTPTFKKMYFSFCKYIDLNTCCGRSQKMINIFRNSPGNMKVFN